MTIIGLSYLIIAGSTDQGSSGIDLLADSFEILTLVFLCRSSPPSPWIYYCSRTVVEQIMARGPVPSWTL